MKSYLVISIIALSLFLSCEKDEFKRDEIIGNWTLEKIQIDTIKSGRITGDSLIIYGNTKYLINATDTLSVFHDGNTVPVQYMIQFISPDRIRYSSCPVNFLCLYSVEIEYKILKLTTGEMLWHRILDQTEQRVLKETLFFSKW